MAHEQNQPAMRRNGAIRAREVRVVGADGAQLGVMQTGEALGLAREGGLDLVEVSPAAKPPVCRIMDWGKFCYDRRKQDSKRKPSPQPKEMQMRPNIGESDLAVKIRHVRRFLQDGSRCRLVVVFKGREITHKDIGMALLARVAREVEGAGRLDAPPRMEGRLLSAMLSPLKKS